MMKWICNLKISNRLVAAFGSLLFLLLMVGIAGIISLKTISPLTKSIYEDCTIPLQELSQIDATFYKLRFDVFRIVMTEDMAERQNLEQSGSPMIDSIHSWFAAYTGRGESRPPSTR